MTTNRSRLASMTPRQIGIAVAFVVVLIVIIWQIKGLFGGGGASSSTKTTTTTKTMSTTSPQNMASPMTPQQPVQATFEKKATLSQHEMDLMREQQEMQAKYLTALNELQMLKIQREMAEANQAIVVAKLATVTAQKNMLNLLAPPPPPVTQETYAANLIAPEGGAVIKTTKTEVKTPPTPPTPVGPTTSYTVISVSQIRYRWNAVLGYQGNLYSVAVGDLLPVDGSKVIAIDKGGVTVMKDGVRKRYSMVPVI